MLASTPCCRRAKQAVVKASVTLNDSAVLETSAAAYEALVVYMVSAGKFRASSE